MQKEVHWQWISKRDVVIVHHGSRNFQCIECKKSSANSVIWNHISIVHMKGEKILSAKNARKV